MKTIFTNGCFDVLHRGHLELFKYAKSLGDRLIVGIDSDTRVKANKGVGRPFNNEEDRIFHLQSIKWIDKVVIFDSDKELVQHLKSHDVHSLVIGSDWKNKEVVGKNNVKKIVFFDRIDEYSTTRILKNGLCD